jgi:hypothetical protein
MTKFLLSKILILPFWGILWIFQAVSEKNERRESAKLGNRFEAYLTYSSYYDTTPWAIQIAILF